MKFESPKICENFSHEFLIFVPQQRNQIQDEKMKILYKNQKQRLTVLQITKITTHHRTSNPNSMSKNFDYIIVGGGASGSALASVLAKKGTTLLIERGANHTFYPQSKVNEGWPQIAALAVDVHRIMGSGHWTGTANILGGGKQP